MSGTRGRGLRLLLTLGALVLLVGLVATYDAPLVLAGLIIVAGLVGMLAWPEAATILLVFLIYTNVLVVGMQEYGVPEWLAAAPVLVLSIPLAVRIAVRREEVRVDGGFYLMVLFLGVLVLATVRARDAGIALDYVGVYLMEGLALYWLMLNGLRRRAAIRRGAWTLLLAGALLGGLSLYQSVTGSYDQQFGGLAQRELKYVVKADSGPASGAAVVEMRRADRAEGPLGAPNRFAQLLIVLLPLAMGVYRAGDSRLVRWGAAAAGGLILAGVFLTYSRGAFLTLVVLALAMAAVGWIRPIRLALAAGFLAVSLAVVAPGYYARVASISEAGRLVTGEGMSEVGGSIRGRATEMLAALNVFLDHPVLGVGPGQYMPFYSERYQQRPDVAFRSLNRQRRAHTLYFELAAETGLVGLLLFLGVIAAVLRGLWMTSSIDAGDAEASAMKEIATGFGLGILAYLVTGIFLHFSYQRFLWLFVGIAAATVQVALRGDGEAPAPSRVGAGPGSTGVGARNAPAGRRP